MSQKGTKLNLKKSSKKNDNKGGGKISTGFPAIFFGENPSGDSDLQSKSKLGDAFLIQALHNFTDGAYISDSRYSLHYISPSLQRIFGEAGKKKCFEYLFNRNDACPWCHNQEVFSGKVVSWKHSFESIAKVFDILEVPLYYSECDIRKITIYRDITEYEQTRKQTELINASLIEEQVKTRKKNVALKEILNQVESEKDLIRRQIQANIDRFILPILFELDKGASNNNKKLIQTLRETLRQITSPFIYQLENKYSNLSPRETEICKLINEGYSSKEIAQFLGLSEQTIYLRRKHIRHKLGIANRNINLATHLRNV